MGNLTNLFPPSWHVGQQAGLLADNLIRVFPCNEQKRPVVDNGLNAAVTDSDQVQAWFSKDGRMIGVPMGEITCIDIDAKHQPGLVEDFEAACVDAGLSIILESMPKQTTVNGGAHYFCKVQGLPEPIKNMKLARNAERETIIETRGKGGYVIVAPSKGYSFERGNLLTVPDVTVETWQRLFEVADGFNVAAPAAQWEPSNPGRTYDDESAGNDYNKRGDLFSLLQKHGWVPLQDGKRWSRPGKNPAGVSATWDSPETPGKFYVFTSNAHPFEPESSNSPFAVYALLEHGGDFSAAAAALAAEGYGIQVNDSETISDEFKSCIDRLCNPVEAEQEEKPGNPDDPRIKLYNEIQSHLYDELTPVAPIPAILTLGETPVIRRGNISTITAQAGAGKTHVLSSIIRALSTGERCLGFEGKLEGRIVYLDFEQSKDDFDAAMRYQAKAGANVKAYHLTGYGWKKARQIIEVVLSEDMPSMVVIDGYADCVRSVNDDVDCAEFVANLLYAAQMLNMPILGVLHLNPGSDFKSRGHLGSELDRKSETVLQIHQDGEIREIWTSKARKKRIHKGEGIRFEWSDEARGFIEVEGSAEDEKKRQQATEARQIIHRIYEASGMEAWKHSDLVDKILEVTGKKSKNTAQTRIDWALEGGVLTHCSRSGVYTYAKNEGGNLVNLLT